MDIYVRHLQWLQISTERKTEPDRDTRILQGKYRELA